MRLVCLDMESFFSDDFTLSKMSTEAYIRDPRFKAHGAAIKWSKDHQAKWYDEPMLRHVLKEEDWSDVFLICHHAQFDGLILSHHYDVHPKLLGCTMSMARLMIGTHVSASLESLRKHFNIPPKTTPYNLFKNKQWEELTPHEQKLVAEGCEDEVESIFKIFGWLSKEFPKEEYEVIDSIIKMFTEPALRADLPLLGKLWKSENERKVRNMENLKVTATELQSAEKFAELLRAEGIEPETKLSVKENEIYAFAKSDEFMQDLLEHENERVRTLAEARLGLKSTILQTRAETLGWTARRGALPVYLSYAFTGTLRPTGGDKTNFLNMKRGSDLRRALLAPEGFLLAPVDSSQIELRVGHYLAGGVDDPLLQLIREGKDPYADLASKFYGEPVYKAKEGDPRKFEMECRRGAGKQARLMCIYGAAAPRYQATAKSGQYGPPIDMTLEEAERHVKMFRDDTPQLTAPGWGYWAQAGRMLARLAGGEPLQWGPLLVKDHRIYLPNETPIIYDTLEFHVPDADEKYVKDFERKGYWRLLVRRKGRVAWKKMWGSKLFQNICEAVAHTIVKQAQVRLARMGYRTLNCPYDELLLLIPKDGKEQGHLEICMREMKREPTWLPGIPLDCEGSLGERYSK